MSSIEQIAKVSINGQLLPQTGIYTSLRYLAEFGSNVPVLPSINDKYVAKIYSQNYFEILITLNVNISNIDNSYIELYKCSTLMSTVPSITGIIAADRAGLQIIKKSNTEFLILIPPRSIVNGGYYLKINHPLFNNNYAYIFFRTESNTLENYSCYRESITSPLPPAPPQSPTPTPTITTTNTPTPTITPTVTSSITPTPSVTPTLTPTISITPTVTPSITPSYSPTQTTCVYETQNKNSYYSPIVPSPTPSLSQNISSLTFSSNIILLDLIPNNRYIVSLSLSNTHGPYSITPNEISFLANSSKSQTVSILITKLSTNKNSRLNVNVNDLDSLESKNFTKFLTEEVVCSCTIPVLEDEIKINNNSLYTNNISDSNFRLTTNYGSYAAWGNYTKGYVTTVGTNAHPSYYGTYDKSGNVWEWIEDGINNKRFLCGGSWKSNFFELDSTSSKSKIIDLYDKISEDYGFRVATYNNPYASNDAGCYVSVGDKCNIDYKGVGNIRYDYMIGKYPVTVLEYVRFLNSVCKNPLIVSLLNIYPFDHPMSCIDKIYYANSNTYTFKAKNNLEYKPITLVSHINAQRYVNWLSGSLLDFLRTTSLSEINISYYGTSDIINMLDNGLTYNVSSISNNRKTTALYFLPNFDEWYKAAYYNHSYQLYSKYSMYYGDSNVISFDALNQTPLHIVSDSSGNGPKPNELELFNCLYNPLNSANYMGQATWNDTTNGNVTTVGSNGGPSFYGTFDQSGNVWEWNDLDETPDLFRGTRGGAWYNTAQYLSSSNRYNISASSEDSSVGFRIASLTNPLGLSNFVDVGDPDNDADTRYDSPGYGNVAYLYKIGKYAVTNCEYVLFLNSVDPEGINPENIYNSNTSSSLLIGQSIPAGIGRNLDNDLGSKYFSKSNFANKPVGFVSWFDCARYCNWLHNDKVVYNTTNDASNARNTGAYNIGTITNGNAITKQPSAKYYIPTENEWYKAAYYKGGSEDAGYWNYATQRDSVPAFVSTVDNFGNGSSRLSEYSNEECVVEPITTTAEPTTTTVQPTTTAEPTTTTVQPTTTAEPITTTTAEPTTVTFSVTNNGTGNYVINGEVNPTLT